MPSELWYEARNLSDGRGKAGVVTSGSPVGSLGHWGFEFGGRRERFLRKSSECFRGRRGCSRSNRQTGKNQKSDVAERVKKIVVEHLGVDADKVVENENFIDDLGADSIDTVELVMAFE